MKKKYLIIVIVLMIFAVRMRTTKNHLLLKNGQTALENHEYDKAKKYLSDVLRTRF